MSPTSTAPHADPRQSAPDAGAWSQPWPLVVSAAIVAFASPLPLEAKLLAVLACAATAAAGIRSRRQAGRAAPQGSGAARLPQSRNLDSHRKALCAMGDSLIAAAHASREPTTVVLFDQLDLPELHAVFGGTAARSLVAQFDAKLQALAGSRGLAMRSEPSAWALVLPGVDSANALEAVHQRLGRTLAMEVECQHEELVLIPRMAMVTVGRQVAPMRHIYQELREKISRAHEHDLLREEYLRRERERYTSRPLAAGTLRAPATAAR